MCDGTALRVRQFPTAGDPPAGLDSPLCFKLPRFGGDDAGTGRGSRPLNEQSLGAEVCARARQTHSTSSETVKEIEQGDSVSQAKLIEAIFGIAA
jgi:hypothetical protein